MPQQRVLIVDDEPYLTAIVSHKLTQSGLEVKIAGDGEEALAMAEAERFDLVVTDFQMPLVSGLEMSCRLKELPATANVPVVMVTARGHEIPPGDLAKTNIKHLLAKPFSARELLDKVNEVLGRPTEAHAAQRVA